MAEDNGDILKKGILSTIEGINELVSGAKASGNKEVLTSVFTQLLHVKDFSSDKDIASAAGKKLEEVLPAIMEGTNMDRSELIRAALSNPPRISI